MTLGDLLLQLGKLYIGTKTVKSALGELKGGMSGLFAQAPQKSSAKPSKGKMKLTKHRVFSLGDRIEHLRRLARKGAENPQIRSRVAKVLARKCGKEWCIEEKKYDEELRAIFNHVRQNVRYTRDIQDLDTFQSPNRTLEMGIGDCLPAETLLLTENFEFVALKDLQPGTKIWGKDKWTEVTRVMYKGILPVDAIKMNNGSWIKATPDHHVFVLRCPKHGVQGDCTGKCPREALEERRVATKDLSVGDIMIQPDRLPFGKEEQNPSRAYIEGLYLADGWCHSNTAFRISGKDGQPKEKQKKDIQEICASLGILTTWHDRYITVKDPEWALRLQQTGDYAPDKHALSLNLGEGSAGALLRGIMADSGANTTGSGRTLTTTSRELFLQARILHKMFGLSCSERYIENHGGIGTKPIWRLTTRTPIRADGAHEKFLRVAEIERNIGELPVYDLTTEDSYVYLPESDATVSNCDDSSTVLASMCLSAGYPVKFRVIRTANAKDWDHIFILVGLPPGKPDRWISLDASVNKPAGWSAPKNMIAAMRDFDV